MIKKRVTEAKVQAELYRLLVNLGYDVYPELKYNKMRIDLTVYRGDSLLCLIEVKNRKRSLKLHKGKQYQKYAETGFPFFYCLNMGQVEETVKIVEGLKAPDVSILAPPPIPSENHLVHSPRDE